MPFPEPPNDNGLWEQVRPRSGWPDANEDVVRELAAAWGEASAMFTEAAYINLPDLQNAWKDGAGQALAQSVGVMLDRSSRIEVGAAQQRSALEAYAEIVLNAKQAITSLIYARAQTYGYLKIAYRSNADGFVEQVAGEVNEILGQAAKQAGRLDSGVATQGPAGDGFGEFADLTSFFHDEIVTNSGSADAARLRELFANGTSAEVAVGLAGWADKVRTGADWDQKGDVQEIVVGDNKFTPIPGTEGAIRYDFWSNLHYGYVGLDVGIDASTLTTGADLADLYDNGSTDPGDRAAILIGTELRERYGTAELRPEHIQEAIVEHYDELRELGVVVPLDRGN